MRLEPRRFASEKVAIIRRHLLEGVAISDPCNEHEIQPTVFYRWKKQPQEQPTILSGSFHPELTKTTST